GFARADVLGARVLAIGDIDVKAFSTATLETNYAGAAGGAFAGVAGTVSVNIFDNLTEVRIERAALDAGGDINLAADADISITNRVGAVAAGLAAVSGAVAVNDVGSITRIVLSD